MATTDDVPQGTVTDVLCWVDDDPGRAQQALDAERSGQNRSTLITQLEVIASMQEDTAVTETDPAVTDPAVTEGTASEDPAVTEGTTTEDPGEREELVVDYPTEITLTPGPNTEISPVFVRDFDADDTVRGDLREDIDQAEIDQQNEPDRELPISVEQVESFQTIRSQQGFAIRFNGGGAAFVFSPTLLATLKGEVDKAVAGVVL